MLLLSSADIFCKIKFFKNCFRNTIKYQMDWIHVGPDLGLSKLFASYQQMTKVAASKERDKFTFE